LQWREPALRGYLPAAGETVHEPAELLGTVLALFQQRQRTTE
jgi:hypothetical protein